MKKISLYISALALAMFGLTACDDNWETPPMDVPTEGADVEPTLTIAELKAMYWQDAASYGTPVTALPDGRHAVIKGTIVSSTVSGNIYKAVYVQDSTGAICIGVDTTALEKVMPMGVGVAIDVTGLQIGRYSGAMQLGKADGSSVNRITYKELRPHLALDYFGGKLDTTVTTLADLPKPSQETIREWGGKLVRINNVRFQEAGQDFAEGSNTSRHITDSLGKNPIIVYDSPYADFAYDTMPYGVGDVVGILSNYNNSWQLLLIDINGVIGFSGEGAPEEKPAPDLPEEYKDALSVAEALELISTGQNDPNSDVMVFGRISSIDNIDTSYGNATYYMMDFGGKKALEVYRGYWLNGQKFTSENQIQAGEYIIVKGKLVNYNGTAEFTSGSQVVYYFGDSDGGDEPGTEEKPAPDLPEEYKDALSVAEALELIATGQNNPNSDVMVFGYISSIDNIDTGTYGNATYFMKDFGGKEALEVYRGYWINGQKFTSENQIQVGEYIIVKGKLVNYNGTYEFTSGSQVVYYFGDSDGGDEPGTVPDAPSDVINVATALDLIANGYEGQAQVKGIISKIDEISTSYGNATYYIVDEIGSTQVLEVFRGYWFNGQKFTSTDQLEVGAEVIVEGKLVNYNGTYEFTTGSKIISYNGETAANN